MASAFVNHVALIMFSGLLVWAGFTDFRAYQIPNAVSVGLVLVYPVHVLGSPVPVDWLSGLLVGAAVLTVGVGLFARRLMGGGDAKLLAAISVWAGPALVLPFIFVTAIAGGLLAITSVAHLRYFRPLPSGEIAPDEVAALRLRNSVPYGLALAAGGLWVAFQLVTG